ncbi:MAG: four helix bundle protein [Phycisphaerales bacterium]|nr:four helix bundle protein [Phycisphaerales bacterium]
MTYARFEDLPVWKSAMRLAIDIYDLTDDSAFRTTGDLSDQLRRATLSISNNIAEGFERGTTAELLMFLYYARGSAGEVRSMLHFCTAWPKSTHLKSQISNLKSTAESISRQIRGWTNTLQNSDIKGQRHLNDQSRRTYDYERRADAFQKHIEDVVRQTREKRVECDAPHEEKPG